MPYYPPAGSGTPGGNNTNIQVNSSSEFYGDDNLTYLASIARVAVGSSQLQGSITLPATTGNALALAPSSATANWTLTFPSSPGTNTYVLQTNGSGVTSWAAPSASTGSFAPGGATTDIQYNSSNTLAGSTYFGWSSGTETAHIQNHLQLGFQNTWPTIPYGPGTSFAASYGIYGSMLSVNPTMISSVFAGKIATGMTVWPGILASSHGALISAEAIDIEPVFEISSLGSVGGTYGIYLAPYTIGSGSPLGAYGIQCNNYNYNTASGQVTTVGIYGSANHYGGSVTTVSGLSYGAFVGNGVTVTDVYGIEIGNGNSTGAITTRQTGLVIYECYHTTAINRSIWLQGSSAAGTVEGILQFGRDYRLSYSSDHTITSTYEWGVHFDNVGAASSIQYTLPSALKGMKYGFCAAESSQIMYVVSTSAQIAIGAVNSTGGTLSSSEPYSYVEIEAISTSQWVSKFATGNWALT